MLGSGQGGARGKPADVGARIRARVPLVLVVLSMAASIGSAVPSTAAAVPSDFVSVTAEDLFGGDNAYRDATLPAMRRAGVGMVRVAFYWSHMEVQPDRYDFRVYDQYMLRAADHGMQVMPVLYQGPAWRSRTGQASGVYPPLRNADMAAFTKLLVRRYGPGGSLWAENPGIRAVPIRSWQVWNEPNLPAHWASGPNAADYVALLREVHDAIKSIDPASEVIAAGIPDSGPILLRPYIEQMYQAGAKGYFNTMAVHAYGRDFEQTLGNVSDIRAIMSRYGDPAALRATEFGWASEGRVTRHTTDEFGQAVQTSAAITEMSRRAGELGLRGFTYYNWQDNTVGYGGRDWWGLHIGLRRIDTSDKPALDAFSRAVACIDAGCAPPSAAASVLPGGYVDEPMVLDASASADSDGFIRAYRFDLDDDRTWDTPYQPSPRFERTFTEAGTYTVRTRVVDGSGARAEVVTRFAVEHRPPDPTFTIDPGDPRVGEDVTFTSTSTDRHGEIAQQEWDLDGDRRFGEEGEEDGAAASRSYANPGVREVSLRVTNEFDVTAEVTAQFSVSSGGIVLSTEDRVATVHSDGKVVASNGTLIAGPTSDRTPGLKEGPAGTPAPALAPPAPAALKVTRRGTIRFGVACSKLAAGNCRGKVALVARPPAGAPPKVRKRTTVLGRRSFKVPRGRVVQVEVRLTRAARTILRRRPLLDAEVRLALTPGRARAERTRTPVVLRGAKALAVVAPVPAAPAPR